MSNATAAPAHEPTGIPTSRLGIWIFLASEVLIFGGLITCYLLLRMRHPEWGQEVKAVVVPEAGATLEPDALAAFCGETLAAYKVPTKWELRGEPLPRNPSGKILKNVLAGDAQNTFVEE